MPIYEYRCEDCAAQFEKLILAGFAEQVICPRCGGDKAAKLFSTFGMVRAGGSSAAEPAASTSCCAVGACRCRH